MLKLKEELGEVNNIEILGVVTNIKVDGNLSASFDEELHNKALDVIESLQVKVER